MSEAGSTQVLKRSFRPALNRRKFTIVMALTAAGFLLAVLILGLLSAEAATATSFLRKNLAPDLAHPFGTDWLGRDMLARTLRGLSISIVIGLGASAVSAVIAAILGASAACLGGKVDALISWAIDVAMGVPHLLLLILISFALGKGAFGVTVAVAVSHWPLLARVIRGEIIQIREANYVKISQKLGHGPWFVARKHMLPQVFPQFLVGLILLFPHAILHEAALTFLGFGLSPEQPGVGIILSESMKYLSLGYWWLAVFPGLALLATVLFFDQLGGCVRRLIDPHSANE